MNYTIKTTTEQINSTAGIILAGKILQKIDPYFINQNKTNKITHYEIIRSMYGLLVQGRCSFEEIELFRYDKLFKDSFRLLYVPATETLRLNIEKIVKTEPDIEKVIKGINKNLVKQVKLTPIIVDNRKYIPVDVDVSTFDNSKSNKEGVSRTYNGYDGYAPIFSYIGREGYMLDNELREGRHHCQKETPSFLKSNIATIRELNLSQNVLFRLDGGNDASDNVKILSESGHFFIIKRNIRKEPIGYWHELATALGERSYPREGKIVYTGVLAGRYPANDETLPAVDIVFRVTEKKINKRGNHLLFPEIEVETYWTNLYETPDNVIELYHKHGTSEQFHSELKTDMNVERLPSGKMAVNSLILNIAMIAFNTLRWIGQIALDKTELLPYKHKVLRKRIRKIISDLIRIGCKIVIHARKKKICFWEKEPWLPVFKEIYQSL